MRQAGHSRRRFGGHREAALERDGYRCRGCGAGKARLHVHHRSPGCHATRLLVALCPACHARVHRLLVNRHWLPGPLLGFWREQHPGSPLQLQLALEGAG